MANNLIKKLPRSVKAPTLVLVSPLRRCIETALWAFHPKFNFFLRTSQTSAEEDPDCKAIIQHFAKGNITFMLDPRLQEVRSGYRNSNKRNQLPSRREMDSLFKKYFIFPEEFYPKYTEEKDDDPDEDQDWYKEEGMWSGCLQSPQALERGASLKEFLYNRPEEEIIVVTSNAFIDTLVHEPKAYMGYLESRSCVWKPTVSGRMRLVPFTFPESRKNIVKDEDYSEYWPYRLSERSELFNKWYAKPTAIYENLLKFEERKKFLGLDELTLASLEAELSPEDVEKVKNDVKNDIEQDYTCHL